MVEEGDLKEVERVLLHNHLHLLDFATDDALELVPVGCIGMLLIQVLGESLDRGEWVLDLVS